MKIVIKLSTFIIALFLIFSGCDNNDYNNNNLPEVSSDTANEETSLSEENSAERNNTYYLVKEDRLLEASINSGIMSLQDSGFHAETAEVVVVGPAIKSLRADSELESKITEGISKGVKVVACENAMRHMQVEKENLIEGITVVPNGFYEIFRLQQQNYLGLEL